jgi:hypothetical protein
MKNVFELKNSAIALINGGKNPTINDNVNKKKRSKCQTEAIAGSVLAIAIVSIMAAALMLWHCSTRFDNAVEMMFRSIHPK